MALDNEVQGINWSEPFDVSAPHIKTEDSALDIPEECIKCLLDSFGHSHFRKMQWKIISSIMNNARDNCVIMATGYGKSLCYQFPSVYRNTITLVVSPLISLMQDQVTAMCFYKLKACFLGSAQTNRDTVYEVIDRQYNVVYVTPEYITSENGEFLIKRIIDDLELIAIDEAHCISKWGHDFRYAYRKLSILRNWCPSVPILAMTATATTKVRDDIISSLCLKNPQIIATGFDRPNLEFIVKPKTEVWNDIGQHINNVKIGSIIVYCISRKATEEVAETINARGHLCGVYHSGLSLKLRQKTHDEFIHDRIRVVVATIAFGMGINKPDVRLVIHYGVSKDIEGYYQEVGRAGRDGLPAKCLLFHRPKDWALHRMIRQTAHPHTSVEQMEKLMKAIRAYVETKDCRRRYILSYFGDDCRNLVERLDCCDNCSRNMTSHKESMNLYSRYQGLDMDGQLDITQESTFILNLLQDMKSMYGLRKAILVLRGSKSKDVPLGYSKHYTFGKLKHRPEKYIQAVINSLVQLNILTLEEVYQTKFSYTRCLLTNKAKVWLSGIVEQTPIKVKPNDEYIPLLNPRVVSAPKTASLPHFEKKQITHTSTSAGSTSLSTTLSKNTTLSSPSTKSDIFRPLLKVRSKLASLFDVMPYLVASTKALEQLAKIQPTTMEELRSIRLDGYSEEKTQRFGPVFLKVIKDYHAKFRKTPATRENEENGETTEIESREPATSVEDSSNNNHTTLHPNGNDESPIESSPETENSDLSQTSTQESVKIIEPPPPPLIEIESDIENAVFADWGSDDDSELDHVGNEVEQKLNVSPNKQPKSENTDLDLLIDALKSEDLTQNEPKTAKQSRTINAKKSANTIEYESDSGSEIFDADWDLEIDESDLTQISQQAEEEFKFNSSYTNPSSSTSTATTSTTNNANQPKPFGVTVKIEVTKTEPSQGQTKSLCVKEEKKTRLIQRRVANDFEYEDEDDDDSDFEAKPVVSPKKRALPSWMQVSQKRKR